MGFTVTAGPTFLELFTDERNYSGKDKASRLHFKGYAYQDDGAAYRLDAEHESVDLIVLALGRFNCMSTFAAVSVIMLRISTDSSPHEVYWGSYQEDGGNNRVSGIFRHCPVAEYIEQFPDNALFIPEDCL